jgi:DHA1 family tetracycline resistance protein-like MFS transporter
MNVINIYLVSILRLYNSLNHCEQWFRKKLISANATMLRLFAFMKIALNNLLVFMTVFLVSFSNALLIPILPKMIIELTGYSVNKASVIGGWLMFAYAAMQFCFAPLLGHLSDVFGRKRILQLSLLSLFIDYLLQGFAVSLVLLFVGRLIAGLLGANYSTAAAYFADISNGSARTKNFALIGAVFGLGFVLGPICGAAIGNYGLRLPFFISAVLMLIQYLLISMLFDESLSPHQRVGFTSKRINPFGLFVFFKRYKHITGLVLSLTLVYVTTYAILSHWPYYTMHAFKWNQLQVAYSLAYTGAFIIVSQSLLIQLLLKYYSSKKVIMNSMVAYVCSVLLLSIIVSDKYVYLILVLYCIGGISIPAIQGVLSNQVPEFVQGELQGAITGLISASYLVGPLLINYIFHYFTSSVAIFNFSGAGFALCACIMFIAIISARINLRKLNTNKQV